MAFTGFGNRGYEYQYNIPFFDDIHNFFPDLLYAPLGRFNTASDILIYIRDQVRLRADRFSAAQRNMNLYYNNIITPNLLSRASSPSRSVPVPGPTVPSEMLWPPAPAPVPVPVPASVPPAPPIPPAPAPSVPLFRTSLNAFSTRDIEFMDSLLNIFTQPSNTINIIGATLTDHLTPVIVYPSPTEIAVATTVIDATGTHTEQQCTICFENFAEGQRMRQINHCQHTFHKTCIDRWFTTNVRCPNCRYDIRGNNDENENDDDDDDEFYAESDTQT